MIARDAATERKGTMATPRKANPRPPANRGQGRKPELTLPRFQRICQTLSETGERYKSCMAHGFSYHTVLGHRSSKKEWQAMWDTAVEMFRDNLEAEAFRRAFTGVDEPVYYQGRVVGHIRKYSDRLLEQRLRAELPEKYRDNLKVDATVKAGVLVVPATLSQEDWNAQFGPEAQARAANGGPQQLPPGPTGSKGGPRGG